MKKTKLHLEILETYQAVVRKEKVVIHISHLDQQLLEEKERLKILEATVIKEEKEYQKLEQFRIRDLFFRSLATDDDQLEKEKEEYLLAFVKYKECQKAIDRLLAEKEMLLQTLYPIFEVEKKLEQLLEKQRKLKTTKTSPAFLESEQNRVKLTARLQELEEALDAGKKARELLQQLQSGLEDIKKMGFFTYSGKGKYSSYKKKKYIENTTTQIAQIHTLMDQFARELADVSEHYSLNFKPAIQQLNKFIAGFLNQLISEVSTQTKLIKTLQWISSSLQDATVILEKLQNEISKVKQLLNENQQQQQQILLQIAVELKDPNQS